MDLSKRVLNLGTDVLIQSTYVQNSGALVMTYVLSTSPQILHICEKKFEYAKCKLISNENHLIFSMIFCNDTYI